MPPSPPAFRSRAFGCREPDPGGYSVAPQAALPGVAPPSAAPVASAPPPPYPVERSFLQADRVALSLRGALERTTIPLARVAAVVVASKVWCDFGYARLDDYARERLGRSGRWVRDVAALGNCLPALPALAAALTGEDGGRPIGRVAALLIARVASPGSLDRWIGEARSMSIRALRDAVRAARAAGAAAAPASRFPVADRPPPPPTLPPTPDASQSQAAEPDDDLADRRLVRMVVPSPVLAAFDEAVDLFRAVEGGEATVASFVEALVAEAATRGEDDDAGSADATPPAGAAAPADAAPPVDAAPPADAADPPTLPGAADLRALGLGPVIATVERALAASTDNWSHLPEHAESSWALSLAGVTLARFRALAAEAGQGGSPDLDRQFRALLEIENEMESRLGALLADLGDRRAWPRLRFAGVGHYGEERLGLSRTTAEGRARLARDLRQFPRLREAHAAGRVGREAAALVVRVLRGGPSDAGAEAAWIARATESTIKRMRDEARALGRYRVLATRDLSASRPAAPTRSRVAPTPLDDAAWHASLRREPGLSRLRIRAFGEAALASPDVFQAAPLEGDAFLRLRLPLDLARDFLAAVGAQCRRLTAAADAIPWDAEAAEAGAGAAAAEFAASDAVGPDADAQFAVALKAAAPDADSPSPAPSWLLARMFSIRCRRLPAWVGLLALLEDFVETWDPPHAGSRRPGDAIYIRDGWRCTAPGCTSRRHLEDHHVRYRSRGGGDEVANRVCLCRFHHQRGEHGGLASCRGRAPLGVVWRLGRRDAAPAWYINERRIAAPEVGRPEAGADQ